MSKKVLDSFAKIWKKRLTHENSKSAKAFEVLLKLIGTALLLVAMILILFVFLSAFFVYAFAPDTATQKEGNWTQEVDYFDTDGSYTSQTRMIY